MIKAKYPSRGAPPDLEDIESKLYLPVTRIFPTTQSIPFYLSFLSSPGTLAAFMPFGPQTQGSAGSSVFGIGGYQCTRMRLMRQVIVDAKNPVVQREIWRTSPSTLNGLISSSSEMWDMTTIGEGNFKLFVSEPLSPDPLSSKEHPLLCDRVLLISLALFHPPVDSDASSRPSLLWTRPSLHAHRVVVPRWAVMRRVPRTVSFARLPSHSMVRVALLGD